MSTKVWGVKVIRHIDSYLDDDDNDLVFFTRQAARDKIKELKADKSVQSIGYYDASPPTYTAVELLYEDD